MTADGNFTRTELDWALDAAVRRPVVVETYARFVVWTADNPEDDDPSDWGDLHELILGESSVDGDITARRPAPGEWSDVYPMRWPARPAPAPLQGPEWKCSGDGCMGWQGPGSPWTRHHSHSARCSIARADATAVA